MQFLSYSGPSLYSFCWNLQSQMLTPDFARVLSSWNFACCTYWKHMCMHRTWSGTRFACQNVAPLGLFNLPLQMNSHLAIKRNVSCYVLRHKFPSYTQQEVWRRQSIWQCNQSCQVLWDSWHMTAPGSSKTPSQGGLCSARLREWPAHGFSHCWEYSVLL